MNGPAARFTRYAVMLRVVVVALGLALAAIGPLSADEPAALAAVQRLAERYPVILVPGITGAQLRERSTGTVRWGDGRSLLKPHDGGYGMARPIHEPLDDPSELEAFALIESIRLAGYEAEFYGPIVEILGRAGYQVGNLTHPEPGDEAFVFPYDWRQDNTISARRLGEALDTVRQARGLERLPVALICQSNGAHVCRYLAKYGGASLEEAEAGMAGPRPTLEIRKLILLGSSNGGALRNLREIDRGRTYVPIIGRRMQPEVLFTFPSLYQDMPIGQDGLFFDLEGRPLDVDLANAEEWRHYGFSIFGDDARRRAAEHPEIFGNELERLQFLRRCLDRAERLHRLMRADAPHFATPRGTPRYYSIQSLSRETAIGAVLVERKRGHALYFIGDDELDAPSPVLRRRMTEDGDSHASRTSQGWLSPQETAALAAPTAVVDDGHREMLDNPATLEAILEFLADAEPLPSAAPVVSTKQP